MKQRVHLCFIVTSSLTATTFLRGYLRFLREDGWEVTLICAPGDGLEQLARQEGVALHTVIMAREPRPLRDLVSLARLSVLLRRLRPDVLVYATPKASLLGAISGVLSGVKVRVYEHWGLRLETATGVRRKLYAGIERLTIKLSSHVVANSRSLAAKLRELKFDSGRSVSVLGEGSSHGVDIDYFSPSGKVGHVDSATKFFLESEPGTFTVGFIGRLHPDKGIDTLLDAISICADRGVPIRAMLVGVCDGLQLNDRLARLHGRVGVHLVGEVDDTRPYLNAMDLLVLVSRREGFPNVVLEAAAMEKPAVVANSTGTVDSVVNDVTGVVVRTDAVLELAEVLTKLQADDALVRKLGMNARRRTVDKYAQTGVWRLHADFFEQALRSRDMGSNR